MTSNSRRLASIHVSPPSTPMVRLAALLARAEAKDCMHKLCRSKNVRQSSYPHPPSQIQMRTTARSTRRTPLVGKENRENHDAASQRDSVPTPSSKKARHRLTTAELARLEDVFKQGTHPSRQQKKDLAAELGMDYKTITIWFQNKRQTSKRCQPQVGDRNQGRTRSDSGLRAVSSPSHNATLDASGVDRGTTGDGLNGIAAKAFGKMKPLLDTLNALTSRQIGYSESAKIKDEALDEDVNTRWPQSFSDDAIASAESNGSDQGAEQERVKGKLERWKRIRTLEWACERQTKRRKLSREAYARLGSEEVEDHGEPIPNEAHMDSALSLLSLASSTNVGPPKDVMKGASLLLSFKHSWRRK